jgi:hypothetical protein
MYGAIMEVIGGINACVASGFRGGLEEPPWLNLIHTNALKNNQGPRKPTPSQFENWELNRTPEVEIS